MSSQKLLATDPQVPSPDLEDIDDDNADLLTHGPFKEKHKRQKRRHWAFLAVNIFIFLLNIGILLMMSVPGLTTAATDVRLPHSAHQHLDWVSTAIEWELRMFDDKFGVHGPFRGKPRPELDRAWADPIRSMFVTIPAPAWILSLPTDYTVRIPTPGWRNVSSSGRILTEFQDEKGGLMGTFSFLHNLHCLKEIREYMLPDFYPKTAAFHKPTPEAPIPEHLDHCIDILRQSELCHADMSLMAFEWHEDKPKPVDIHHAQHICANEDKVMEFIGKNSVPPFGSILVHPWTGKSPY
ncbi:hypothetical protein FSARC_8306 [Fusarium sarcochroum]|uniref:Tat pathway signal sequence n=1 Tax=Fusarium sarcochroum TaxID=1208366 RepID=A0A8H4X7B8_9HYPO|nr:hypothetical protein FSARC_8306 [Fusarium sarcochroum]